jgi:hypothetical protein
MHIQVEGLAREERVQTFAEVNVPLAVEENPETKSDQEETGSYKMAHQLSGPRIVFMD